MVEADLYTHLKNSVAVSALVGTRIYPKVAPQNVARPYIVYHVISDVSNQCLGGGVYQNQVRVQIDCWSEKYSEVKSMKQAVKDSLIGFKSSSEIYSMDDYEPETKLFRELIDFKIKD